MKTLAGKAEGIGDNTDEVRNDLFSILYFWKKFGLREKALARLNGFLPSESGNSIFLEWGSEDCADYNLAVLFRNEAGRAEIRYLREVFDFTSGSFSLQSAIADSEFDRLCQELGEANFESIRSYSGDDAPCFFLTAKLTGKVKHLCLADCVEIEEDPGVKDEEIENMTRDEIKTNRAIYFILAKTYAMSKKRNAECK
jgi:hypothetical protein